MGDTLGDKLGHAIGTAIANKNSIQNQAAKSITEKGPDGSISITIPENNIRTKLLEEWELIGQAIIDFLADIDKGTSSGLTIKLGSNSIKLDSSGITIEGTTINLN